MKSILFTIFSFNRYEQIFETGLELHYRAIKAIIFDLRSISIRKVMMKIEKTPNEGFSPIYLDDIYRNVIYLNLVGFIFSIIIYLIENIIYFYF